MNKTIKRLKILNNLLEIRRLGIENELKRAVLLKEWSKVAGYDGIEIGLIIAKKIIENEIKLNE